MQTGMPTSPVANICIKKADDLCKRAVHVLHWYSTVPGLEVTNCKAVAWAAYVERSTSGSGNHHTSVIGSRLT